MILETQAVMGQNYKGEKVEYHRNLYRCDWCNNKFTQSVRKSKKTGKQEVSDTVNCPYCHNNIKTWE